MLRPPSLSRLDEQNTVTHTSQELPPEHSTLYVEEIIFSTDLEGAAPANASLQNPIPSSASQNNEGVIPPAQNPIPSANLKEAIDSSFKEKQKSSVMLNNLDAAIDSLQKIEQLAEELTDSQHDEQKHAVEIERDNSVAFYSNETIYDTIAKKYNTSIDPAIDYNRKEALMAFMSKRCNNEDLSALNDQFIWLRKLDQFVLNLLKITYNGSTPQRAEALEKLKNGIKQVYQQYASGLKNTPQSVEEEKAYQSLEQTSYQSLKETELTIRNSIESDYQQNSWWRFTVGRITGSQSGIATQLKQASADSDAILGINEARPRSRP